MKKLRKLEETIEIEKQYHKITKRIEDICFKHKLSGLNELEDQLEKSLKALEILETLKDIIEFGVVLPEIKPNDNGNVDFLSGVAMRIQREIENKERKQLREWVLKTCFPKELKTLEIIKEILLPNLVFDDKEQEINFSFSIYTICKHIKDKTKYDLLKEVLK